MKRSIVTSALGGLLLSVGAPTAVLAQEETDTDKQQAVVQAEPAQHQSERHRPQPHMIQATFLGVATDRVPQALGSQVKLPKGIGLVVTQVADDSPAQTSGITRHDVLQKLDDQLLVNPEQLAVLIRMHEPGDAVDLTLIRGGETMTVTATLAQHEVPERPVMIPHPERRMPAQGFNLDPDQWNQLRGQLDQMDGDLELNLQELLPQLNEQLQLHEPMQFHIQPGPFGNLVVRQFDDGRHRIEIRQEGDADPTVKIQDADGNLIFEGTTDQLDENTDVPQDLRDKVHELIESNRIEFRTAPAPAPAEPRLDT